MTDTKNTVSDAILAHYIEYADLVGDNGTPAISTGELAAMARELQSLRASIPVGVGVKVKPLEWKSNSPIRNNGDLKADSAVGRYEIGKVAGRILAILRLVRRGDAEDVDIGALDTFEEAKAAAQADYERRILSALDLSPAEGEPVAWQEIADPDTITRSPAYVRSAGFEKFRPLYAAPSNPVVSDEMVERANRASVNVYVPGLSDEEYEQSRKDDPEGFDLTIKAMRAALTTALSVKPQSGSDKQ